MHRRWIALGCYVLALYLGLPWAPGIGLGLARTGGGAWLLGPGLVTLTVAGALALGVRLGRRAAPPWAWAGLVVAAAVAVAVFSSLRAARLEQTHLPEYGLAAVLAWRAVAPLVPGTLAGYTAAAGLGALIGWGDELLQAVTPGRHYDLRDVGLNALGALLGVVVLAAARAGRPDASVRSGDERH